MKEMTVEIESNSEFQTRLYMSQMLYAGQSARENVPFLNDF